MTPSLLNQCHCDPCFYRAIRKNSLVIRTRQTAKLINKCTHLYMSLFPSVCPFFRLFVRGTPHLKNRTSDHNFWYTYIFIFFKMLIFWIVRQVKGQKMVQHEKKIMCVALHISGTIHHMIIICGTQV